ncbi:DUF177 domain-containing protein [Membranicola marinus]|uniref:DUF177 domain-containing protein n=1 Tax=Membranihabitans marinus TaxID=1227546 RepID=A0A953LAL8_9BACT|nr:DUF177 domain-containing protein [Membranihabitans marinus]MBY5957716.1 DUF177 domain-containing protein [Membranihabitans marinus]
MEGWKELVLSLPGLPVGVTTIETTVATKFFAQFEQSPIGEAAYEVRVFVDKKPGLYIVNVEADGWFAAACDRCLVPIRIPVETSNQYFFNLQSASKESVEDEEEVLTLEEGTVELDLRPLVYESIVLSMPMINVYECEEEEQPPCDMKVLKVLQDKKKMDSDRTSPTWDVLKNINFDD